MILSEEFFSHIYGGWAKDISAKPPKSKQFNPADEPVYLDLTNYSFISLYNLMQLYLVVDYCQACVGPTYLKIEGLDPDTLDGVLSINQYNINKKKDKRTLEHKDVTLLKHSEEVYRFISFCYYFGFFDSLSYQSGQSVTVNGANDNLLGQLLDYSGIKSAGSRVLPLMVVREALDVEAFRVNATIQTWLNSLPADVASAPIFLSGEFSHVFGYQLGLNIVEHSGKSWRGENGVSGIIGMRVIRPEKYYQLRDDIKVKTDIFSLDNARGILEICVGDRGNGLINSLTEAYKNYKSKYGFEECEDQDDVLAFAFDEIGTRKELNQRLGGVHALHRILKCCSKYNGLLKVVTGGKEYIYDSSLGKKFDRNKYGLGIYPSSQKAVLHPFGTQFQILIPLSVPLEQNNVFVKRNPGEMSRAASNKYNYKVVDIASYLSKDESDASVNIGLLRQSLMEEPDNIIIVYDFSSLDIGEDEIVLFLTSQKAVLHAKTCLSIGIDAKVARSLREREQLNITNNQITKERSDLLHVLSVYHRLLVVVDNEQKIWWFGLGVNHLDEILDKLFKSTSGLALKDIASKAENEEVLRLYLNTNSQIFQQFTEGASIKYRNVLKMSDIMDAISTIVRLRLKDILTDLECVESKGRYKLPAKDVCVDRFIQSTPLLQVSSIASQLADWLFAAIRELIEDRKEILLLTITAPSELLAKNLSHKLIGIKTYLCNLGHTTAMDEDGLISGTDWDGVPAIIIADVIYSESTVSKLIKFAELKNIELLGCMSLFRMCELKGKDPRFLYWAPHPKHTNGGLARFFIAEFEAPQKFPLPDEDSRNNDKFFYIEQYSLEPFSHNSLLGSYEESFPKKKINRNRLNLLEDAGALRSGHWVSGDHHFRVTTCINTIFSDEILASNICSEILQIIISNSIDIVLLPLHSHISDIVNRLSTAVKLASNKNVEFTYCIMAKEVSLKSFYLLPKPIKKFIYDHGKLMSSDKVDGLRIMVLDDAVATGRTLETILRSIVLQVRKTVKSFNLKQSPVGYIHSYAVIDRQGRAKSTFLTGVDNIKLKGDGEWEYDGSLSISFKYNRWLDVDMPVSEKDSCELCNERYKLQTIINTTPIASDHSALHEISRRVHDIRPQSSEIPAYLNHKERRLPLTIQIGQIDNAGTAELVLWEFSNLISRGCPFDELIGYYIVIHEEYPIAKAEGDVERNLEYLRSELIRTMFKYWNRVCDQSVGQMWVDAILPEIYSGNELVKCILWEAGKALNSSESEYSSYILSLFKLALQTLSSIADADDKDGIRRENIGIGTILMIIGFNSNLPVTRKTITQHDVLREFIEEIDKRLTEKTISGLGRMYLDELKSVITRTDRSDNFMPSLVTLLNQTIRAGRHNHDHLMPSLLSLIVKGKVNQGEFNLIKDMLSEILQCLEIVDRRYYPIFDDTARLVLPGFKKMLLEAKNHLNQCKVDDISPSAILAVRKLYNHFPHQHNDAIYQSLKKTQINMMKIIGLVKGKCESREEPIILTVNNSENEIMQTFIIVPNEKLIEEILRNFTVNAKIVHSVCPTPMMQVGFSHVHGQDGFNKVILEIKTNYDDSKGLIDRILAGPGIKEANTRNLDLFRVRFQAKRIEEPDYFISVKLEFCSGYPC